MTISSQTNAYLLASSIVLSKNICSWCQNNEKLYSYPKRYLVILGTEVIMNEGDADVLHKKLKYYLFII